MGSSAFLLAASALFDLIGTMPGNIVEQSDAPQAYTQSLLGGEPTWIFLPRSQWPPEWKGYKNPVCRLRLALCGHPLSGLYWERHSRDCVSRFSENRRMGTVGHPPRPYWPAFTLTTSKWQDRKCSDQSMEATRNQDQFRRADTPRALPGMRARRSLHGLDYMGTYAP